MRRRGATIEEVQNTFAACLRRVEHGENIEIRRRNKVVARLVPAGQTEKAPRDLNWGELKEWRRKLWGGKPASGKPLSRIVSESRGRY